MQVEQLARLFTIVSPMGNQPTITQMIKDYG
jgi:hypothetical protein